MILKSIVAAIVFASCLTYIGFLLFVRPERSTGNTFPLVVATGLCTWGIITSVRLFTRRKK